MIPQSHAMLLGSQSWFKFLKGYNRVVSVVQSTVKHHIGEWGGSPVRYPVTAQLGSVLEQDSSHTLLGNWRHRYTKLNDALGQTQCYYLKHRNVNKLRLIHCKVRHAVHSVKCIRLKHLSYLLIGGTSVLLSTLHLKWFVNLEGYWHKNASHLLQINCKIFEELFIGLFFYFVSYAIISGRKLLSTVTCKDADFRNRKMFWFTGACDLQEPFIGS